jgi:tetratricopeptide (TPR) repeat protein
MTRARPRSIRVGRVVWGLVFLAVTGGCKKPPEPAAAAGPVAPQPSTPEPSTAPAAEPAVSTQPGEAPAAPAGPTTDNRLAAAVQRMTTGTQSDWVAVRAELEALADASAQDALVHYNLGVVKQKLGDLEGAAASLSRAVRVDKAFPEAYLALGLVEVALEDEATALRRFRTGLEAAPDFMPLHEAYVATLRGLGRPEEAVEAAKAALLVNTSSQRLFLEMALAHLDLGDIGLARFVLDKADTMPGSESSAVLQATFGWVLYKLGERYPAEFRLKKAVELDPEFIPGLVYLSMLYLEDRNYEEMVALLERAAAKDPTNAGIHMNLGSGYRGLGRVDDAERAWRKALELEPRNPEPLFNIAILLADDRKEYDTAISRFRAYIAAGGKESARATDYIDQVQREADRAAKRKKAEEERLRKQKEREEKERLLREAEEKEKAGEAAAEAEGASSAATGSETQGDGASGSDGAPPQEEVVP